MNSIIRRAREVASPYNPGSCTGSPSNPSAPRSSSPQTHNIAHNNSAAIDNLPTRWDDPSNEAVGKCVMPITSNSYKGSSGRVGVLGGSTRCAGSPYYAAIASLKVGADVAYVFSAEEAAIPIKCYSPELIVSSVYNAGQFERCLASEKEAKEEFARVCVKEMEGDLNKSYTDGTVTLEPRMFGDVVQTPSSFGNTFDNKPVPALVEDFSEDGSAKLHEIADEQQRLVNNMVSSVTDMFDRLDVLIIGPGLGRCPLVLEATAKVIMTARERNMPMVIDDDGLFLLMQEPYANLVCGYKGLVLTPNLDELKGLTQTLGPNFDKLTNWDEVGGDEMSAFERATEGVVIVKKGSRDIIFSTAHETSFQDRHLHVTRSTMLCEEEGGLKRSGGLGDILSGCIGTFVAWNRIMSRENLGMNVNHDDLILACWSACCITKRATRDAFVKKRRSMRAPDVLDEIGGVVDEMTGGSISWE